MPKYRLELEGDFEKGDCKKCPIGAASDILKGKGVIYSCMYALGGGSKEYCPLEDVTDINVGEIKRGEWFLLDECSNSGVYCSVCHKKVYKEKYANQKLVSNFCPNCGADMRGGK